MVLNRIWCTVGDRLRLIDSDLFSEVHQELADQFRAEGLTGAALDHAIVDALPHRLAEILGGTYSTRH
jgi:hypothetical protein